MPVTDVSWLSRLPTSGLGIVVQLAPSQWRVRVCSRPPARVWYPTTQASFAEIAWTALNWAPGSVKDVVQLEPSQCSIELLPTAQTSLLLAASMAVARTAAAGATPQLAGPVPEIVIVSLMAAVWPCGVSSPLELSAACAVKV